MTKIMDFVCPVCSSSYFTTIRFGDGVKMTRQCKGHYTGDYFNKYTGCEYTWESKYDEAHGLPNLSEPQEPFDFSKVTKDANSSS